jgi:hypothetical protein
MPEGKEAKTLMISYQKIESVKDERGLGGGLPDRSNNIKNFSRFRKDGPRFPGSW